MRIIAFSGRLEAIRCPQINVAASFFKGVDSYEPGDNQDRGFKNSRKR
jgi:hypothetical protein